MQFFSLLNYHVGRIEPPWSTAFKLALFITSKCDQYKIMRVKLRVTFKCKKRSSFDINYKHKAIAFSVPLFLEESAWFGLVFSFSQRITGGDCPSIKICLPIR